MKIKKKKIKIFVTGATGFLGSYLVSELKRRKLYLKCLVREDSDINLLKKLKVKLVYGDIRNKNDLKTVLKGVNIVIHLAGIITSSSQNLYYDVNVRGTKNLIEACKENKVKRFIHVSTQDVVFKRGAYSISKLQGEEAVKNSKLEFTIFRPTTIYGEGNCGLKNLVDMIKRSPLIPIMGSGKNKLQPVYVKDIVKAIVKTIKIDKTIGKVYFLGGAERISFNDLINLILRKLQLKKIKIHLPLTLVKSMAYLYEKVIPNPTFTVDKITLLTYDKICDNSLAERDLNFKPIDIRSGIKFLIGDCY